MNKEILKENKPYYLSGMPFIYHNPYFLSHARTYSASRMTHELYQIFGYE